ncbi:predicted protein [Botrytis cinerea T4]|uniref:Uncharacterized protein n=1 Tax=Botryotinia fuckeliana (strain T4) TaxID=999810 RepID=G2YNG0_BOTF4|nr:predicted protein [Botrytis cinerea T4]
MVRCRFLISQDSHMFEDCYCEWCDGTPKAGEQGSGKVRRKFGCGGKYVKDTY